MSHRDSMGLSVKVGDRVCFRGRVYTVASFVPDGGRYGTAALTFEEGAPHVDEVPDEIGIDLIRAGLPPRPRPTRR